MSDAEQRSETARGFSNAVDVAQEVLGRDLMHPLWPGLTESDWDTDAKLIARAYLWAEGERQRLEREIAAWHEAASGGVLP